MSQHLNKEGKMKTKKQLIVCLTVCLVVSFVATVYAARLEEPIRSAPVTVVNPASKPIPVTEVNKYPVQKEVVGKFNHIAWVASVSLYTVPSNKRLVIEYFSCGSTSGSYSTSYSCYILSGGYPGVDHRLPTTQYGHYKMAIENSNSDQLPNPKAFMSAGQSVKIYAEPGTEVLAGAYRQNQGIQSVLDYPEEYMSFSFSGYLVDAAQPLSNE
jgi:hypothetical protein